MQQSRRLALALLAVALAACSGAPTGVDRTLAALSASVPDVPQAIANVSGSALLKQITDKGPYLGFDTSDYPGDAAMQTWRDNAGYDWVGYYLQAPCHKDGSWSGERDTLQAMGWGIAVVYVGQQTWEKSRHARSRSSRAASCATNLVTADRRPSGCRRRSRADGGRGVPERHGDLPGPRAHGPGA